MPIERTEIERMEKELEKFIRIKLNLNDSTSAEFESFMGNRYLPIRPDIVFIDGTRTIIVEISTRPRVETIGRLLLMKEILQKDQRDISDIELVLAAKAFPNKVEETAEHLGIRLIMIPHDIPLVRTISRPSNKDVKITSDKSWKIITRLLKDGTSSIRQLALKEDVSYGWANKVVNSLLFQGIIEKVGNQFKIANIHDLLNGVGWERTFDRLKVERVHVRSKSPMGIAKELTANLDDQGLTFSFAGITAGALYTGYAFKHDSLSIYLEEDGIKWIKETYDDTERSGLVVDIFRPDRNVFKNSQMVEGVSITSPSQTLLDLAGLGYSGRDLTNALVNIYAEI